MPEALTHGHRRSARRPRLASSISFEAPWAYASVVWSGVLSQRAAGAWVAAQVPVLLDSCIDGFRCIQGDAL